jgi:hypothetical protein
LFEQIMLMGWAIVPKAGTGSASFYRWQMMNAFACLFDSFITRDAANVHFVHAVIFTAKLPSGQRPPTILQIQYSEPRKPEKNISVPAAPAQAVPGRMRIE